MTAYALDPEDELDDFDSDDLEDVDSADHSYLKGMWGSFRSSKRELAEDTILAHGMVQSFVNAFARDGRYIVTFDPDCPTAGTDMRAKQVVITPAPIADKNLTAEEAGLILTGLAVHEISHPRYGRQTTQAVEKVFPSNEAAKRLSNLLDDIRIERRFVADYPGYAGIFDPTLDYVGAAGSPKDGSLKTPSLRAPINLAISATRYSKFSDWSDPRAYAEFVWWNDWAVRGSREDAPKRHVDFIREALLHVAAQKVAQKPTPSGSAPSAPGSSAPSAPSKAAAAPEGSSGGETSDDHDGAEDETDAPSPDSTGGMSDEEINEATMPVRAWDPSAGEDETAPTSSCSGSEAVDKAALDGDTNRRELDALKSEAEQIVQAARNQESDGHGNTVDVNRSLRGITVGGQRGVPSAVASKYIRNAIMQSRTGHTDHAPFKRHGRLDQRGLSRIAQGDFRIFEKRTAPSVGRYNIWVMVDASDSMTWGSDRAGHNPLVQAAGVAHAMAVASQTIPTVRMSVWAWTSPFRSGSFANAGAALAWKTGQPTDQALRLATVSTGGTPDSTVMGWAARAITKEVTSEETPVIIFVSDGDGYGDMNERIAEARRMGVEVYGVSFGRGHDSESRFGKSNYVPFTKSIAETARPLAKLFARITGAAR